MGKCQFFYCLLAGTYPKGDEKAFSLESQSFLPSNGKGLFVLLSNKENITENNTCIAVSRVIFSFKGRNKK
jgi:hypothetical protein